TDEDDFMFLTNQGTFRQPSCLHNAFAAALKAADIDKKVSPHGMRYLFNDLLRLAGVDSVTARSLTGHVTDEMREHYSTVRLDEKREAMKRVAAQLQQARTSTSTASGDPSGDRTATNEEGCEKGEVDAA